jgi:photosystem II stability/assembly factor-like uncharacterized protein
MIKLTKQAAALPRRGTAWRNAGPYNGVVDVVGVGSGAEELGPVGGIGTALAVDPSDPTGNTVYLGTIGGLYKSTDGGKSLTNVVDRQLSRVSIGAIAVDPRNPNDVYAGTGVSVFTLSDDAVGAGVYVSHDAGRTWSRPTANTTGYGVNAIDVSPTTGTVLVGTTSGLWRSTNHGASFVKVPLPDNATHTAPAPHPLGSWVTTIVTNPTKPEEVTLAVGFAFGKKVYGSAPLAPGNGLYRSEDGGATFTYLASTSQLTQPLASSDPIGRISLAYSTAPGGTGVLWALVADAGRVAGARLGDLPSLPVSPTGGSVLNGLYRSGDDGATWQLEANAQILTSALGGTTSAATYPLNYAAGVQAYYNNWVVTDPTDPNRIYLGLEEAFTGEYHDPTGALPVPSTTFTAVEKYANACGFLTYFGTVPGNTNGLPCPGPLPYYGSGSSHPDQHSFALVKVSGGGLRAYAGNDGGWWSQTAHSVTDATGAGYQGLDNGSWTSLNAPPTVLPWDVTMLQDGSFLLALQDNGVAHMKPDGTATEVCGGDGVYVFPGANPQSYYCGIAGQTILATTDDFHTTIDVTPSGNATGATFFSPWAVDLSDPNHLIAAAGNVDETTEGPNSNTYDPTGSTELLSSTWQTVFTPPAPPHAAWDSSAVFTRGPVSYVGFCSVCRPSLASGTADNPTLVTAKVATNVKPGCTPAKASAACWHLAASAGLPHEQISDFAVDPANASTVYVGLRQFIVMGADPSLTGAQKVMVSHDGGATFTDLTGNLPKADVHRIAWRDGQLIAATDVGIFISKAGTRSWQRLGAGLPEVTFRSMRLSADGRYLLAGAYGRGGWIYDFGAKAATSPTKVPKHPKAKPVRATAPSGSLAATGLAAGLPPAAGLLIGLAIVVHRRRRREG